MISSSRIFARISGGAAGRLALVVLALGGLALHLAAGAEFAFAATAKRFPEPTGYVNDFAGIVDPASADSIVSLATELQEKTGAELAVVTLADLGGDAIDPAATALFREWGIGRTGHDDGVLVLLALAERKVRIEPGYGLEGPLPDGRCGSIVRRVMGPDLSAGHYGAGLLAGARAVAGAIAADKGVAITGSIPPRAIGAASGKEAPAWVLLVVFIMMVLFFSMITRAASRFGGHGTYRDWRMGRRGSNDPWGGFGGGWGGMGGFGGGGGGGGGFGGFGGGRSGGGGASGGF